MAPMTDDLRKHLARVPTDLEVEFPCVPPEAIALEVDLEARELVAMARFNDFVPLLVHRAVRERLRDPEQNAAWN